MISPLSQGPSEKLRKNVAPSCSFVPYLQPGSLLPRTIHSLLLAVFLWRLWKKGEFWSLRKLKAVLEQICRGSCVHSENHTGKTHVRKVGQSAASWPCFFCTQGLVG